MANKFLFIELRDDAINCLLASLRSILSQRQFTTAIHVTLKGPQQTFDLRKSIDQYMKENPVIKIGGVGRFSNGASTVVYLAVDCGDLKKYRLWSKPHFKGQYVPHITIYEGLDRLAADAIFDFLTQAKLQYQCSNYEFTIHRSGQPGLFSQVVPVCTLGCRRDYAAHQALLDKARNLIHYLEQERTTVCTAKNEPSSLTSCERKACGVTDYGEIEAANNRVKKSHGDKKYNSIRVGAPSNQNHYRRRP